MRFLRSAGSLCIVLGIGFTSGARHGVTYALPAAASDAAALQWFDPPVAGRAARATAATDRVRFVVAPDGNEAKYIVREQLANRDLPNDAIGRTAAITGALLLDAGGNIVKDSSHFEVDLTTLQSDQQRRDRFIQRNTLETAQYPNALFVPASFRNLPAPLPASGEASGQLLGDLTVHGVTRPATWNVSVHAAADGYTGTAITSFVFGDFNMTQPRLALLLSVKDTIRLEYDFHLVRETASKQSVNE